MPDEKEYMMLRDEIYKIYDILEKTRNLFYVAVAAIFTCSLTLEFPILFLAAYCMIIPCYWVTIDYQRGMWKIGTYLAVFHEGKDSDFNWERRNFTFSCKNGNRYVNSYSSPFFFGMHIFNAILYNL